MANINWDKRYETGLPEVDKQHHFLMDLISRFGNELCQAGTINWEAVNQVFAEVVDYSHYHFAEEEKLMADSGLDPDYQQYHAHLHKDFIEQIHLMHSELQQKSVESAERLHHFLMHWLVYHILGIDQGLAPQIAAIQEGVDPAEARRIVKKNTDISTGPLLDSVQGLLHIVSERNRELVALNASLEAKVALRTQELITANQKLEEMALTDMLTGLPNRRYALHWLTRLWQESLTEHESLAVMMIDADGFKPVNDTFGHDAGDIVLTQLARTLKESVRTDDVVCRLGGDEFLMLCPRTSLNQALQVAEKVRKNVNALAVPVGAGIWQGSVSIGVAEQTNVSSPEALLKVADESVYAAKRNGRNRVEATQNML